MTSFLHNIWPFSSPAQRSQNIMHKHKGMRDILSDDDRGSKSDSSSTPSSARYGGSSTMTITETVASTPPSSGTGKSLAQTLGSSRLEPGTPESRLRAAELRTKARLLTEQAEKLQKERAALQQQPSLSSESAGKFPGVNDATNTIGPEQTASPPLPLPPTTQPTPQTRCSKTDTTPASTTPPGWSGMSSSQKWSTDSNLCARELGSKSAICADLHEPEYAMRDAEIRDALTHLVCLIQGFSREFFSGEVHIPAPDGILPASIYAQMTPQTVKVVHCVASGGPAGQWGWHNLFLNEEKRQALVCGVIGNVLVEQVFENVCFGFGEEDKDAFSALERELKDEDGFTRHYRFSQTLRHLTHDATTLHPTSFTAHIQTILAALTTHLTPLLSLLHPSPLSTLPSLIPALLTLTTRAALLSLHMRLDPHTFYRFTPSFKEDTFIPSRMHCTNVTQMQQSCPHNPSSVLTPAEQARRATLSKAELRRSKADQALTQIIVFRGVVAFRKGGWEDGGSTGRDVVFEEEEYGGEGYRERVVTR
ncbi:hypothetical protein GGP41_008391, partial [Bipolaris sorokiniana]